MRRLFNWKNILLGLTAFAFVAGGMFLVDSKGIAMQPSTILAKTGTKIDYEKAFTVYTQKCSGCHNSVADPEKPGRTRDEWHIVVNVMHDYGLELTNDESEMIIDLLYKLRRGMEREAG
jgi:cytochrome c1